MHVFSLRRGRRLDPRLKMAVVLIFLLGTAAVRTVGSAALRVRGLLGAFGAAAIFAIRLFHFVTSCFYGVSSAAFYSIFKRKNLKAKRPPRANKGADPVYNRSMRKEEKEREENPVDQMIQGNKDEAESTLRLWGKKNRKHLLPNSKKPK